MKKEPTPKPVFLLGLILFVYLVVMILFLLFAFFFISNHEELYNGTLANDFINNPRFFMEYPNLVFCYQYMPFAGGTLVISLLAIPFIFLFGNSLFSLKLFSIIISAAILVVLFYFLLRFFSLKAAVFFGILYAVSPPYWVIVSLILWGNHRESILLTALLFLLMFIHWFDNNADRKRYLVIGGMVAGFGMYFDYIFIITILTVLIFQFILQKNFFIKKDFLLFTLSFLAGLIPFYYSSFVYNFRNIVVHDEGFLSGFAPKVLIKKFFALALIDIPESFWIEGFRVYGINIPLYLYYSFFIISFFFFLGSGIKSLARMGKPPKEFIFVLYIAVFALVYTFSKFYTGKAIFDLDLNQHPFKIYRDRFFIILLPFIFILISLFWSKIKNRLAYVLVVALLAAIPASSYTKYLSSATIGECFFYKGYSYNAISSKLASIYDYKTCITIIKNLPAIYQQKLYKTFGSAVAQNEDISEPQALVERLGKLDDSSPVYQGIGNGIMKKHRTLDTSLKRAENFKGEIASEVAAGVMEFAVLYEEIGAIIQAVDSYHDESMRSTLYRAAGRGAYNFYGAGYINGLEEKIKDNPGVLASICKGAGEAVGNNLLERSRNYFEKDRVPRLFQKYYDPAYSEIVSPKLLTRNIDEKLLPYVMEGIPETFRE